MTSDLGLEREVFMVVIRLSRVVMSTTRNACRCLALDLSSLSPLRSDSACTAPGFMALMLVRALRSRTQSPEMDFHSVNPSPES